MTTRGSRRAGPLFRTTGEPWQTAFALHLALGMLAGSLVTLTFAAPAAAIVGGLCAGLTAGISARVPAPFAGATAMVAAIATLSGAALGVVTSPFPLLVAVAVVIVIVAASLAAGTGQLGAGLGLVASFAFVFATSIRILAGERAGAALALLLVVLCGTAVGVVVAVVSGLLRAKGRQSLPPRGEELMLARMLRSLRTGDRHLRDGIRRAIPLALTMIVFSVIGGRDAYWVFLAAFAILLPTGKPVLTVTLVRVVGTFLGVIATGVLALVLPTLALAAIAAIALVVGVAAQERHPVAGAALTALGAIMIVGLPSGAVTEWAAHRLVDTLIGASIALAAMLLLWPRDAPSDELSPR